MAAKPARSAIDHSHSRFCSIAMGPVWPKVLVFSVDSIWKIRGPLCLMISPWRQLERCSSELS